MAPDGREFSAPRVQPIAAHVVQVFEQRRIEALSSALIRQQLFATVGVERRATEVQRNAIDHFGLHRPMAREQGWVVRLDLIDGVPQVIDSYLGDIGKNFDAGEQKQGVSAANVKRLAIDRERPARCDDTRDARVPRIASVHNVATLEYEVRLAEVPRKIDLTRAGLRSNRVLLVRSADGRGRGGLLAAPM